MGPPTEQLIRDYLNRLSVAARDLAAADRRALLERIRGLIEQKADLTQRPSTMDVGRVIARLGDPAGLVEQERRRLAAQGKSAHPGTSGAPVRQRFLARALGREHGRLRGPSISWSALRDSGGSPPLAPSNGVANGIHDSATPAESETRDATAFGAGAAAVPEADSASSPPASVGVPAAGPVSAAGPVPADGPVSAAGPVPPDSSPPSVNGTVDITPAPQGAEPPRPPRSAFAAWRGRHESGAGDPPAGAAPSDAGTEGTRDSTATQAEAAAASGTGRVGDSAAAADTTAAAPRRDTAADRRWRRLDLAALDGPVRRPLGRLLAWVRKRPLEAAAVALMGIGGPIFPPVFLIGATLALASELWDGRDKWVGLALPIVLTVIGLAVGIAVGGRAHWQHESWVYLDVVSRVAPALGAGYLAWRSEHGRRPPAVRPFSRPRRTS